MHQRVPQSQLVGAASTFQPTKEWSRLSFLDLVGIDERTPLDRLEPAYIEGMTLVAVWPVGSELESVTVVMWRPERELVEQLHQLQVEWPAALCDVRVRLSAQRRIELEPCRSSLARQAMRAEDERSLRVRHALERGVRALGRSLSLAA